jgi:predicted acyl esterase
MLDEYTPREQEDTVEVIEWLAKQPWCSGNVGMMGLSWGGIASMQAALRQPDALKAIIPIGASVDRYYADGAYLVGGYAGQGLGWGGVMFGYCIRPPDPAIVGDAWRDMWFERLGKTPMFAEKWLNHQVRDETWKQGSVCENYDKIQVPVLGVSGWNDCWPNTMIRLLENIDAPCRAVSGAWAHVFPNLGGPGPMVGFLQLALEWWDHWLKGIDNGVMDDPKFLAYLQDSHAPDPNPNERPGRWVGEDNWPTLSVNVQTFGLKNGSLLIDATAGCGKIEICSPVTLGLKSGEYMPISGAAELPQDQSGDDARSVCFDSEPLAEVLDLLGTTHLHLRLSSDSPSGLIAARICDVTDTCSSYM